MRIFYRARQFWHSVFLKTDPGELAQAQERLTRAQWQLFLQLQPAEQAHALGIFQELLAQGENHPDLLVAALLHDVGKLHYRMNPLERTLVVVVQALLPGQARRWGNLPAGGWEGLPGWRKAFILAEHHADWGAELARGVGVSPLAERLIRGHQHPDQAAADEQENSLLHRLWVVDNDH